VFPPLCESFWDRLSGCVVDWTGNLFDSISCSTANSSPAAAEKLTPKTGGKKKVESKNVNNNNNTDTVPLKDKELSEASGAMSAIATLVAAGYGVAVCLCVCACVRSFVLHLLSLTFVCLQLFGSICARMCCS
jgi:hypothetical protein